MDIDSITIQDEQCKWQECNFWNKHVLFSVEKSFTQFSIVPLKSTSQQNEKVCGQEPTEQN